MNKNLRRLAEPGKLPLILLVAFAAATLLYGMYTLAAIEGGAILLLMIFFWRWFAFAGLPSPSYWAVVLALVLMGIL